MRFDPEHFLPLYHALEDVKHLTHQLQPLDDIPANRLHAITQRVIAAARRLYLESSLELIQTELNRKVLDP
jgi:hypothetical protein